MSRVHRRPASDLLASGWLTPHAAADVLGITVKQLERRAKNGDIRRREIAPGTGLHLYEVPKDSR